jgi:hypothetical protein
VTDGFEGLDPSDAPDLAPEPVELDGPLPTTPDSPEEAVLELAEDEERAFDKLFQDALKHQRMMRRVKRELDLEEHAALWRRPPEYGTLADELAMPEEPVTYRVERVIPTGANVVLTAQYKTGKTTMVNHLVKCLADSEPFLGKYPVQPLDGRVGIFNYEVGRAQYLRWMRDLGIVHTDRVVMSHLRGLRMPLAVRDVEDMVVDWLKRNEVQFWILDPYARALIGSGEENDNSAVGTFLDTLDVIKERAGVTELFMPAHTGRAEQEPGQERARGATRIDDWPDVRWILTKEKDTERRYLKCTGRDVEEGEQAIAYDAETRGLAAAGVGRTTVRRIGLEEEILRFVATNPGFSTNELKTAFPRRPADVLIALTRLVETGLIRAETGARRKKLYFPMIEPAKSVAPPWEQPDLGAGIF